MWCALACGLGVARVTTAQEVEPTLGLDSNGLIYNKVGLRGAYGTRVGAAGEVIALPCCPASAHMHHHMGGEQLVR